MKPIALLTLTTLLMSCSSTGDKSRQQTSITKKNADTVLSKGTSQTKVLETFGSPNVVTSEGKREAWSYLRRSREGKSGSVGATVFESATTYLTGGWYSVGGSSDSSTSNDTTLIVYFDEQKKVISHSFRSEIY